MWNIKRNKNRLRIAKWAMYKMPTVIKSIANGLQHYFSLLMEKQK